MVEYNDEVKKAFGADYDRMVDAMASHALTDIRGVAVVSAGFKMAIEFIDSLEGDKLEEWVASLSPERAVIVDISNRVTERATELLEAPEDV